MSDFSIDDRIRLKTTFQQFPRIYGSGERGMVVHRSLARGMYYIRLDRQLRTDPPLLVYWNEMEHVVSDSNTKVSWEECEWNPCV